ncbi:FecCD family ABC transporter permease [Halalkalibacterium ligniniphilum]|uniref:FecCD family ABC transporter permease n=1 Tax=Halalkalibacterium ligniniphilum TaxID=1134413 RepID=UPI00034BD3D0|nr:iron ABC transporter permease [Halalkalibacterium ligniniphilum]
MKFRQYKALRLGKDMVSLLLNKRGIKVILILFFLTVFMTILSMGMGELQLSPIEVVKSLFGYGDEMTELVVMSFRLPRIIVSLLVGAALAVSGAILQGIVRNPLASPDILGITGGAAVAVVSFLAFFSNENNALTVSIAWMPLAAFLGATAIGLLVYLFAWKNGVSPIRLVLIGIGLQALTQSLTTLFMILGPIHQATQATIWLTGSVYGSNWGDVTMLVPWTALLVFISFFIVRHLNVQELGESVATSVGSNVNRNRFFLLLISTALAGGAVAFAGGIAFVGLIAPHIARKLVGSGNGVLLPVAALVGALLVILADLIGRSLFSPNEIPVGVFTAAIGAPYFIYLLYKNRKM